MERKIKNFDALAKTELRRIALRIAEKGLEEIDTSRAIRNGVRVKNGILFVHKKAFSLDHNKRFFFVGVGKCAVDAAIELEEMLGERLTGGIVLDVKHTTLLKKIKAFQGTHPFPTEVNISATKEIVEMLDALNEEDLVLVVVSGGGSTLLCYPDDMGCAEEANIVKTLMEKGATIQEMNVIRKHTSLARGGNLARYAYPARVISLIFSDVPGDDIQFIASGPTVRDTTTIQDAEEILSKYDILQTCGLESCGLLETPKEEIYFKRVENILFVSNQTALDAMKLEADLSRFSAKVCTSRLYGEAREVGLQILEKLRKESRHSILLFGGETTVTLRGKGVGGRNQEVALSVLPHINEGELILTLASDGRDNTDAAGAICDIITKKSAETLGLAPEKFLNESDSFHFFEQTKDGIFTGNTGSNVSDLIIAIKE